MIYRIVAEFKSGDEVVDSTNNREEAKFLLGKYMLAFNCSCHIETKD